MEIQIASRLKVLILSSYLSWCLKAQLSFPWSYFHFRPPAAGSCFNVIFSGFKDAQVWPSHGKLKANYGFFTTTPPNLSAFGRGLQWQELSWGEEQQLVAPVQHLQDMAWRRPQWFYRGVSKKHHDLMSPFPKTSECFVISWKCQIILSMNFCWQLCEPKEE